MSKLYRANSKKLFKIIQLCYSFADNSEIFDADKREEWLQQASQLQDFLIPLLTAQIDAPNLEQLEAIDGQLSVVYQLLKKDPKTIRKNYSVSQQQLKRLIQGLSAFQQIILPQGDRLTIDKQTTIDEELSLLREGFVFGIDDFPKVPLLEQNKISLVPISPEPQLRGNIPSYSFENRPDSSENIAEDTIINEDIFEPDDRTPVNTNTPFFQMICCLELNTTEGLRIGTGFLIGAQTVLTAAHNLIDNENGTRRTTSSVNILPGRSGDRTFNDLRASSSQFYIPSGWTSGSGFDRNFDYALIFLPSPLVIGTFGLATRTDSQLNSAQPNLAGYPIRGVNGVPLNGRTQLLSKGGISTVSNHRLNYKIDTEDGQSGSPLWIEIPRPSNPSQKTLVVIGIHTVGTPSTNSGTRISASIFNDIDPKIK